MEHKISKKNKFILIQLSGDIDLYCSQDARKIILKEVKKGDDVIVDLSGVSYLDSSGVACLVEGYQLANEKTSGFSLVGISESAMNVLKLARLDTVFTIYKTLEDIK